VSSPLRQFPAWQRREMRRTLIKQYGAYCQLCLALGRSKRKALIDLETCNQPRSWSIDHIKPISRGGLNILANMWPAHRSCNTSRGSNYIAKEGTINADCRLASV
jgi:5-methylcytosine-specific restriction endonuclease McrA